MDPSRKPIGNIVYRILSAFRLVLISPSHKYRSLRMRRFGVAQRIEIIVMAIFSFLRAVLLALISSRLAFGSTAQGLDALEECPDTESSVYDYIVVGSGAGGGPVAARLSENGFSGASYCP